MAQIKITIDKFGNPKVEAVGFTGENCTVATAAIERALADGSGGVDRVFKEEWSQYETNNENIEAKW